VANPTRGIQYAAEDVRGSVARGLQPMGGVPALNNPLPAPVVAKNGSGPDILGDGQINENRTPDALSDRYGTQPIPDSWPQ
jgi:hypothetical protein